MDESVSIILDGLVEELSVSCCSMILPSGSQIREGKEFSMLTNGVSGVAVVLRVGLSCRLRELGDAEEEENQQEVTLSSFMDGLREPGRCRCHYIVTLCSLLTCSPFRSFGGCVCGTLWSVGG